MRSLNNTFILFLAFQRNLDAIWLTGPYINSSKEILIENLTGNSDSFGVLKALWVVCALETGLSSTNTPAYAYCLASEELHVCYCQIKYPMVIKLIVFILTNTLQILLASLELFLMFSSSVYQYNLLIKQILGVINFIDVLQTTTQTYIIEH